MEILNIFNKIADSNLAYYLLIIILIVVVIAMIYLIVTQNKEMKAAQRKDQEEREEKSPVEEIAEEIKEEKEEQVEEQIDRTSKIPIHDSVLQMVNNEKEEIHEEPKEVEEDLPVTEEDIINYYGRKDKKEEDEDLPVINHEPIILKMPIIDEEDEPMVEEEKTEHREDIEKVSQVEEINLSREKKEELLDATLTNIPKVPLLEQTMTSLPPLMDYLDNTQDLMDLTKELEVAPKKRTIELTPFEEEQEQNAIISYDELIDNKENIQYKEEEKKDDIFIKEVDLEETIPEKEVVQYEHEENFLARLKRIQGRG